MLKILSFLLIIFKLGWLNYLIPTLISLINICISNFIQLQSPEALIPRWVKIISYLIIYIIIIILLNNLILILWEQWA